jgi:ADP-ribose pyrophosphatase YjhB (NUDIX family)
MKILIGCWWAIIKDKKLLLEKRTANKKNYPNFWTFPAWILEETDENLEATAIREIKEEVNLDFTPTKKLWFYETIKDDNIIIWFIFLWNWKWKIKIQESEVSKVWWFNYEETKKLDMAYFYNETIEDLYNLWLID